MSRHGPRLRRRQARRRSARQRTSRCLGLGLRQVPVAQLIDAVSRDLLIVRVAEAEVPRNDEAGAPLGHGLLARRRLEPVDPRTFTKAYRTVVVLHGRQRCRMRILRVLLREALARAVDGPLGGPLGTRGQRQQHRAWRDDATVPALRCVGGIVVHRVAILEHLAPEPYERQRHLVVHGPAVDELAVYSAHFHRHAPRCGQGPSGPRQSGKPGPERPPAEREARARAAPGRAGS